eukprot:TRINITY_DN6627_c0_g1_i7.p2 TRINITY_DN6627_c0_g1~~TRINITY_DN6627_c0_g1_i7.p2  ORF type:complete len:120 (-),score=18.75 TRINITY_DN6627_c0_g1_i7:534-893(-)
MVGGYPQQRQANAQTLLSDAHQIVRLLDQPGLAADSTTRLEADLHRVVQGLVEAQTRQARPQVQSQKAAGLQDQRETAESEVGAAPGLLPYSSVLLAHFSVPLAHYSVPLAPESVLLAY